MSSSSQVSSAATTTLPLDKTVASLVLSNVNRAKVLQKYNLDYCCHGQQSLREALAGKSNDFISGLKSELDAVDEETKKGSRSDQADLSSLRNFTLNKLATHIVETHHQFLRNLLTPLGNLVDKVARVHASHNEKLAPIREEFHKLAKALIDHLDDEEANLFPALAVYEELSSKSEQDLTSEQKEQLSRAMKTMRDSVPQLEHDHDDVAIMLGNIRSWNDNFSIPSFACMSYKSMLKQLDEMEADIKLHISKENGLLHIEIREAVEKMDKSSASASAKSTATASA